MFRSLAIAAIAAAAAFGPTTAAQATIYNVTSAGLYHYGTVQMTGNIAGYGPFDRNELAGAVVLQGTTDAGKPFSVITFCFDVLHSISVGLGSQSAVNYTYSLQPVSNDLSGNAGTGNALSVSQIERMSGLAKLGAYIFNSSPSNLSARLSAVQAAIWSVEYGFTASNFSVAGAGGYYAAYMAKTFPGAAVPVLVSSDGQGQLLGNVQGLGIGTVPEPESWTLMIVGFGLVGFAARRRPAARAITA
jgi:hypothetical protein